MGITGLNVLIDPDATLTMSDVAGIRKDPVVRGGTMHSPDPGPRPDSAQREPTEDELDPKPPAEDVDEVTEEEHDELEKLGEEDVAEISPDVVESDETIDNAEEEDEPNDLSEVDKEFDDEGEDE